MKYPQNIIKSYLGKIEKCSYNEDPNENYTFSLYETDITIKLQVFYDTNEYLVSCEASKEALAKYGFNEETDYAKWNMTYKYNVCDTAVRKFKQLVQELEQVAPISDATHELMMLLVV